jgi:hypothetical protein
MSAWFSLWKSSLDVASGAPKVIAHRTTAMRKTPWSPDTVVECNRMVAEKMLTAGEAWWSLWRDSMALRLPRMSWPPAGMVLPPLDVLSHERAVRAAGRALKPYARRVAANQRRLRSKAARGR